MLKHFKLRPLFFIPFILIILGQQKLHATSGSSWLQANQISVNKLADFNSQPQPNGNIDCLYDSVAGSCDYNAPFGVVSQQGTAKLNGGPISIPVFNFYVSSHPGLIAIPASNTVINYSTEPAYGLYLYFTNNFYSSVKLVQANGSYQYQMTRPPDGKLADQAGHRLAADTTAMAFSSNGRWMVVSDPNVAMLRVDLMDFSAVPFGGGYNYTSGLSPGIQTAISSDGRYAAVASKTFNTFVVYDLNSCPATPSIITKSINCQFQDLNASLKNQIPGFTGASNIRFVSDNEISFYANYSENGVKKVGKFVAGTGGNFNQLDYLAMGDSYISGEGAFKYLPATDTGANHCHISTISYPYLLARDLNFDSFHSVACSGAHIPDIVDGSGSYGGQKNPKTPRNVLDLSGQTQIILDSFAPGYLDQLEFVKTYQPKAVTLSIGGNDMGFSKIIRSCVINIFDSDCYSAYEDRLELVNQINNQVFPALVSAYQQIKNQGAPNAKIYVIGYPQIANPSGNCGLNVHLDSQELQFAQGLISYLDSVIQIAANRAGIFYADTENALNGHRLCEAQPGSVAVNGLTLGNNSPIDGVGPFGNESYHPNDLGHELLENAVLAATNNLTAAMPAANPAAALPPAANLALLQAPRSGRAVNNIRVDNSISANVLNKQSPAQITASGVTHSLKPGATYSVALHSTPTVIGSLTANNLGDLNGALAIPAVVENGFHQLQISGQDINNQTITIQKIVYVGAGVSDLNADGLTDSQQACGILAASGVDYDQDDIDDACDANIMEPPVQAIATSATAAAGAAKAAPAQATLAIAPATPARSSQPNNIAIDTSVPPDEAITVTNFPRVLGDSTSIQKPKAGGHFWPPALLALLALTAIAFIKKIFN